MRTIADAFQGKSMSHELIQDGFPLVSDADHYEGCLDPVDDSTPDTFVEITVRP